MRILLVVGLATGTVFGQAKCARTPELAVVGVAAAPVELGESGGYRVETVKRDLVGRGSWAVVRSCSHPEWPAYMLPAPVDVKAQTPVTKVASVELAVRAGERVFVRSNSTSSRMQMAGIANRSGMVGDLIPVSMAVFGSEGSERRVQAVIKGKGEVELR